MTQSLSLISAVPEIDWPAVPTARGMGLMSLLFQLEQTQWLPPPALLARQLGQLGRLAAHAQRTVPFYADRLAGVADGPTDEWLDAWRRVPVLSRQDIQSAGDALISRAVPESHGGLTEIFTSGSTGRPIRSLRTQLWELFWSAFTVRDHLWHRRDLSGTLAVIRESGAGKAPYPDGDRAASWGRSTGEIMATGPSVSLNITTPIDLQVEWLQRQNPDYLLSHPTMIERLAGFCRDRGIRLERLRQVETIAEVLRPSVRRLCREAWDVPVVDMYTAREAGYLALQCPETEGYHVQAEGVFVEVLDTAGRPCGPGEVGRVIVTPLHNFAMPLIRYDIGDFAEVGGACSCGRGLPVLTRILGRRQNMLVMPSGEERWPMLSSGDIETLLSLAPIGQYQFVQHTPERIELRLGASRSFAPEEQAALVRWVQEKFDHPFDVTVTRLDELPRTASGKLQDFVSHVVPPA